MGPTKVELARTREHTSKWFDLGWVGASYLCNQSFWMFMNLPPNCHWGRYRFTMASSVLKLFFIYPPGVPAWPSDHLSFMCSLTCIIASIYYQSCWMEALMSYEETLASALVQCCMCRHMVNNIIFSSCRRSSFFYVVWAAGEYCQTDLMHCHQREQLRHTLSTLLWSL